MGRDETAHTGHEKVEGSVESDNWKVARLTLKRAYTVQSRNASVVSISFYF